MHSLGTLPLEKSRRKQPRPLAVLGRLALRSLHVCIPPSRSTLRRLAAVVGSIPVCFVCCQLAQHFRAENGVRFTRQFVAALTEMTLRQFGGLAIGLL